MTLGIGQTGTLPPAQAAASRTRFVPTEPAEPVAPPKGADRVELSTPPTPPIPPELHKEIDAAYQRAIDLASQNRELHFSKDEETGRVIVQVRDLEGHVIRTIPNEDALHVAAGAAL